MPLPPGLPTVCEQICSCLLGHPLDKSNVVMGNNHLIMYYWILLANILLVFWGRACCTDSQVPVPGWRCPTPCQVARVSVSSLPCEAFVPGSCASLESERNSRRRKMIQI
ncbi:uncharacterized protein LOC144300407 [Canis aureus]